MEYQKSPETAALSAGTGPGIPPPVSAPQTSLRGVFSFQGPENHLVTCLLYREHAVVMDADYLLGKHGEGGDAVPGSRFGEIRTPSDPAALLGQLITEDHFPTGSDRVCIANSPSNRDLNSSDALVEVLDGLDPEQGLVEGIEHTVLCRDADGVEFSGTLSLEEVRPASPDGKYPAVMQPVVRSTHPAPATDKLNIVLAAVDFSDDRAGWIGEEELRMNLRRFSADEAVKIWTVLTIFPGRYAPLQTALQASGSTLSPEKQGRNSGDRTRC